MKEDVKVMEAQIKELEARGITLPLVERKVLEKKITEAKEKAQPTIQVFYYERNVFKCTCQMAGIYVWNPSNAPSFHGSIKFFIGNGSVIDPDMTRPRIPSAFLCRDKRFPEFMRTIYLMPNASQLIQLSFYVPEDIEVGSYFGNAFLIEYKQPFPVFVTGAYAAFEVFSCRIPGC